jgi:hypothetical protein
MRIRASIFMFVVALSSTLEAQTTWIVDSSNGPGTSFTNLPPAIAAAANGDTIIVRAGTYGSFISTGKALTIRGAGASSTTIGPAPALPTVANQIAAVPSGMTFFMDGLRFAPAVAGGGFPPPAVPTAALAVVGPGTVVLADVTILGTSVGFGSSTGLTISNGAEVHVTRSTINGGNGMPTAAGNSGLVVDSGSLAVDASTITGGTSGSGVISSGGSGLVVWTGVATLSRTSVYGGIGSYGGSYGVAAVGGLVRIAGTSADVIQGGYALFGVPFQGIGIYASPGGSVVVHGSVSILPSAPGQSLTEGPVTTGAAALPYLSLTGTATPAGELDAAQPVTAAFDGVIPLAPFAVVVDSLPGFSTAYSSVLVGELLVPFPTVIALEGTLDAAGLAQVTLTPAVSAPGLTDVPIYVQFGVYDVIAGNFRASNGAIRILRN